MRKKEKLQAAFHLYMTEHGHEPSRTRDVVEWAVSKGVLALPKTDPYAVLTAQLSNALGQEFDVYKGHRYRVNHAVRKRTNTGQQSSFWAILGFAPDDHMDMAFGQRRDHVVGEVAQLKTDELVYNEMTAGKRQPIKICVDFSEDMAERGLFN